MNTNYLKNYSNNVEKKRTSFKKKMLLAITPTASIIFIALGTLTYLYLKNILEKEAEITLKLLTRKHASQLTSEFVVYTNLEKQFNTMFANFEKVNVNDRRDFFVNLTQNIMNANENILALFVDFDKNAFDGQDERYKSVGVFPRSGRFNFCWHRLNGVVEYEKEHPDEPVESLLAAPFYSLARTTKQIAWIEPYCENYSDMKWIQKNESVYINSIVSPVFNKNNKIVGVTGIDIALHKYINIVDNIKPFETGYAVLHSASNNYLSHPVKELLGKNIFANPRFSKEISDSIYKKLQEKKEFSLDLTTEDKERMFYHSVPVNTGVEGATLMLTMAVPYSEVVKEANQVLTKILIFFVLTLVIITIVTLKITKKISSPIEKLAEEAQKIINGDLSFYFDSNSNDEIDDLAKSIQVVSQNIRELVAEINTVTFSATLGQFNTRCDLSKFKGEYRTLLAEVNETIDVFSEPLTLLTDVVLVLEYPSLKYLVASGSVEKIFGYTIEEYKNIKLKDTMPKEYYDISLQQLETVLKRYYTGEIDLPMATFEGVKYHKDGSPVWTEITFKILFDNNKPYRIISINRKIDERKKYEETLKESENLLKAISENTTDLIWIVDAHTLTYKYQNKSAVNIHGYSYEEITLRDLTFVDLVSSEDAYRIMNLIHEKTEQFKRGEIPKIEATFEVTLFHKNGHPVYVEVAATANVDEDNSPVEFYGVTRVINERKKMELALKESEAKYTLIANTIKDIIMIIDFPSLQYVYMAGACEEMTGYTPAECLTLTVKDLVTPESLKHITNVIETNLGKYYSGKIKSPEATFEIQQYHKNGSIIWMECSAKMSMKPDGTPDKIIAVNRLIEDRKKIETILKENEKRYRLMADNTNDMFWTLDVATRRFTFMSGACYEISGYTVEEYLNLELKDILPPNFLQLTESMIDAEIDKELTNLFIEEHTIKTDTGAVFEVQQYHKNGSLIWVEYSIKFLPDENISQNAEIVATTRLIDARKKTELKLKDSEIKHRLLAENTNDMIWMLDIDTLRFTYVTGAYNKITGFTREELLNIDLKDFLVADSFDALMKEFNTIKLRLELESDIHRDIYNIIELCQYHKEGFLVWAELSFRAVQKNEKGGKKEFILVGSTRLINERKMLYSKLQASEQKYRVITENSKDPIWTMDLKTMKFTYMSPACSEALGWTPEDYLNAEMEHALPTENIYFVLDLIDKEVAKHNENPKYVPNFNFEMQQYHKNGNLIWIEVVAKILTNDAGELTTIVGVTRNIDAKKKLELELKRSEKNYRLINDNMRDGIWSLDVKTMKFLYKSDASRAMDGFTLEEARQQTIYDIFPPEYSKIITDTIQTEFCKYYAGEIEGLPQTVLELQQYHKDGSLMWIEISAKTMPPDENGEITTLIGTTRRIDDRKIAEAKIKDQQEELEHQKAHLEKQKEELEKINAQKDKFFSIIAHDLRNPFAALLNTVEILHYHSSELTTDIIMEYVVKIHKGASHIYALLENLLNWAYSSMGAMQYNPTEYSIYDLLHSVLEQLEAQSNVKQITINTESKTSNLIVVCDVRMIETVLRNLISNAIKFSNMNAAIDVVIADYTEQPDYLLISIKDYGIGIPADKLDKLFKIEEKTGSTKGTKNESGSGLGLILCKEFIDKHNCKIWIESVESEGSTFFFTLPKN